ncbi:MAG: FemAB family XrtA/PEP-CTERM system-associated protein, partial [Acetobacteraceae bacterium]
MGLVCKPLEEAAIPAWDRFVAALPQATFFHRAGWRAVIERGFGHRAHYTFAERDGAIVGVLPLVDMRTRLFGRSLISA